MMGSYHRHMAETARAAVKLARDQSEDREPVATVVAIETPMGLRWGVMGRDGAMPTVTFGSADAAAIYALKLR